MNSNNALANRNENPTAYLAVIKATEKIKSIGNF